jgi:hypothetical protein
LFITEQVTKDTHASSALLVIAKQKLRWRCSLKLMHKDCNMQAQLSSPFPALKELH